jgi:hypothetical protein
MIAVSRRFSKVLPAQGTAGGVMVSIGERFELAVDDQPPEQLLQRSVVLRDRGRRDPLIASRPGTFSRTRA